MFFGHLNTELSLSSIPIIKGLHFRNNIEWTVLYPFKSTTLVQAFIHRLSPSISFAQISNKIFTLLPKQGGSLNVVHVLQYEIAAHNYKKNYHYIL